MAQAQTEGKNIEKTQASEEFSLLQASNPDSILQNSSWPKQDDIPSYTSTVDSTRPSFADENWDSNQIFASHHALLTAYARVTKKLSDAEERNKQFQMQNSVRSQDNFRSANMSGASQTNSQTNFAMPPDIEASVNQAWEAYNEKCKECQQLREELERVKQQSENSDHFSRIHNLQEDVLREKAKQDDVVRKLEKTKMEAGNLEKKEIMAREELEKEREYQRSLIQSAEKKHKEMEQRIAELEANVKNEKNLTTDLRKREKDYQTAIEDEFNNKKEAFVLKIRELEEDNIRLKEEVSLLVSMRSPSYNGPTTSNMNVNGPVGTMLNSGPSDQDNNNQDALILCSDVQIIRGELNDLKTRAAEQSHILSALFQNPKFLKILRSVDHMQNNPENVQTPSNARNGPSGVPVQCSEELSNKRKKTTSPKNGNAFLTHQKACMDGFPPNDVRHVIGSSLPSSHHDSYGPTTTNSDYFLHSRQMPSRSQEETPISTNATVILKPTEEFIRGISKENGTNRKTGRPPPRNESFEYNTLFPPMTVARVIHNHESGLQDSNPMISRPGTSENFSDDFVAIPTPSQHIPNSIGATSNTATGVQYTQMFNGNIASHIHPFSNVQQPPLLHNTGQNSLPPADLDSNQFYSTKSSSSLSDNDTMIVSSTVQPTNPFYQDMEIGDPRTMPATSLNRMAADPSLNPNIDNKNQSLTTVKDLMDWGAVNTQETRPPQLSAQFRAGDNSHATPGNRYISSDEDNDSDITPFQPMQNRDSDGHQPKEFVVPKVVHASTLAATTQNRKAFQDSRYTVPPAEVPLRPPIRAKNEQPSNLNQSASSRTNNRPENGGPALPHQYPPTVNNINKGTKRNLEDGNVKTCPICMQVFGAEWSEDRMNRHINNHFSDDENDVLVLD
ncbi:uncharacterized protein LOC120342046 isoform X1 [Styela clava]